MLYAGVLKQLGYLFRQSFEVFLVSLSLLFYSIGELLEFRRIKVFERQILELELDAEYSEPSS